jgi:LysR family transcriptional regulator, benzoate and cis,cis-muconate-responsive activator of ben and cat genes
MLFRYRSRVELRHLRYFVTVGEQLNFTKAAQKLRVAQPALSRQIRDLEAELGVTLFNRDHRAVKLTEAGAAFLTEAKAVLERAAEAVKVVRGVARGERGEIHVGYAPSLTVELLPCALHSFHNLAPGVHVKLHDLSSEEMMHGASEGRLHLSLVARPEAGALRGLKYEPLQDYPICVGVPAKHRLARAKEVKLSQIENEPLVAYSRAEYPEYHAMLTELFAATGGAPRIMEEHDSAPSLIAAAEIGRGLVIGPACLGMLAGARLKFRPLTPAPPPVQLGAVYDPARLTGAATKFLSAVKAATPRGNKSR